MNNIEEHPTGLLPSSGTNRLKYDITHFLKFPLWNPGNSDTETGLTCYAEKLNWWYGKYKVGEKQKDLQTKYIPTRFSAIIAALAIAIIGFIYYKYKH